MEEVPFIEAILASASGGDLGARMVYADWLQMRGDARGELAALQLRRAQSPEDVSMDVSLAVRERALLAQISASLGLPPGTVTRHALGFIDELDLESVAAPDLQALGHRPALGLVRSLRLGAVSLQAIASLARLPLGRRLHELHVGALETPLVAEVVDAIATELPQLTGLGLTGATLPSLVRAFALGLSALDVAAVDLDAREMAAIRASGLPLERLTLHVEPGGGLRLADLEPVLDGTVFPALRHFGLARAA